MTRLDKSWIKRFPALLPDDRKKTGLKRNAAILPTTVAETIKGKEETVKLTTPVTSSVPAIQQPAAKIPAKFSGSTMMLRDRHQWKKFPDHV